MSCQTWPLYQLWVGGKSSPRAMMLSCANITRKQDSAIHFTSSQHHVSIFKYPSRLNPIHMPNPSYSATTLWGTCTDGAKKRRKKEEEKKYCWNSLSWRAGRGTFCFLSKTGNPRSRWICCAPQSLLSKRRHRGRRCALVFFFFLFSNQCCSPMLADIFPTNPSFTGQFPFSWTWLSAFNLDSFEFYGAKIKLRNNSKMGDSAVKPQWENDGSTLGHKRPFCVELVRLCGFTLSTLASSHSCSQNCNFSVGANGCFFFQNKLMIQNQKNLIYPAGNSVCNRTPVN